MALINTAASGVFMVTSLVTKHFGFVKEWQEAQRLYGESDDRGAAALRLFRRPSLSSSSLSPSLKAAAVAPYAVRLCAGYHQSDCLGAVAQAGGGTSLVDRVEAMWRCLHAAHFQCGDTVADSAGLWSTKRSTIIAE
jgi:hypothetical protein